MKKVLIVGKNSYIGKQLFNHIKSNNKKLSIESISIRSNQSITSLNLNKYDSVIYLAGIAHKKESKINMHEYYKVNYELSCNFAKECKKQGVKRFIFISSMSVFGKKNGEINENTTLNPDTHYGKSKLLAEKFLVNELNDADFSVVIVRPPMVYGFNAVGNYKKLSSISKLTPLFFDIENKRSMIYITNLILYIIEILNNKEVGIYHHPQNSYFMNTTSIVKEIAKINKKKIHCISLKKVLKDTLLNVNIFNKIFGDLYYSSDFSLKSKIIIKEIDFQSSILGSEQKS